MSDCDAVSIIHDAQSYAKIPEDAVAAVLAAGILISILHCLSFRNMKSLDLNQKKWKYLQEWTSIVVRT